MTPVSSGAAQDEEMPGSLQHKANTLPPAMLAALVGAGIDHQHAVAEIWICISAFYHRDLQKAVPYLLTLPL